MSVDTDKLKKEAEMKGLWRRFVISAIFTVPLLIIAMGPMLGLKLPRIISPDSNAVSYGIIQLLLATPVLFVGNKFFRVGFKTLINRSPNMDSLIAIGTSAAYIYSLYSVIMIVTEHHHYVHNLYFESAGVILTLITLGKYLEAV